MRATVFFALVLSTCFMASVGKSFGNPSQSEGMSKDQLQSWCNRGNDLRVSNPDSSYVYAQLIYQGSNTDSFENHYAQFLAGYYFYKKHQYDTAYQLLDFTARVLDESVEKGLSVNTKGRILLKRNNFKGAEEFFLEALAIFENVGATVNQFYTLNDLGRLVYLQGDYSKALEYYGEAKVRALNGNLENRLVRLMSNIVGVYTMLKEYDKALEVAQEANNICDTSNVTDKKIALTALSYAHQKLDHVDSAIFYSEQALVLAKRAGHYFSIPSQLFEAGDLYVLKKDYGAALSAYKEAVLLLKDNPEGSSMDQIKLQIAQVYEQLNQLDSTLKYAHEANLYARDYAIKWSILRSSEILSRTYAKLNQPKRSIPFFEMALQYKDSIYNEDSQKQFADLRVKIETLEKVKEIETLESQVQIDQLKHDSVVRQSIAIVLILILLIVFIIVWHRNSQKIQRLRSLELSKEVEQKKKDLHLQTLHMIRMNNNIQEVEDGLNALVPKMNGQSREVQQLINTIKINKSLEREWENFNQFFNSTHDGFVEQLRIKYPEISLNDLRLCSLLKLNLNNAEIASILNVEPKSVVMSKYRLKKKLGLPKDVELVDFVSTLNTKA
ncbi:MAG: tetratricopeptide repeat protein [Reichenbachiella sp.]|uniref:tetratricopeptide repeat protein n=1 Tax=Reichenbachiella sp. TaxID=2184521 RepID=UPI0032678E1F